MATHDVTVKRTTIEYATFSVTVDDDYRPYVEAAGLAAAEADWGSGQPHKEGDVVLVVFGTLRRVKETPTNEQA